MPDAAPPCHEAGAESTGLRVHSRPGALTPRWSSGAIGDRERQPDAAHEKDPLGPARVGIGASCPAIHPDLRNDCTITARQLYAARQSEKTHDRHLVAIRKLEAFVRGKSSTRLTQEDESGFRTHLRGALDAEGKAKSTVFPALSHLRVVLTRLGQRKGIESLPRDVPDESKLSRRDDAEALPWAWRPLSLRKAADATLAAISLGTQLQCRTRALFATA